MTAWLLRGAALDEGTAPPEQRDLAVGRRIMANAPRGAIPVDLTGLVIYPALVNAHDHLELNHFPRTRFRDRYPNAHEWGEEVAARLDAEPYRSLRALSLPDRCLIGGFKNLLSGALTVAHHNPPHRALFARGFPVRVVRPYGWVHSLHFTGPAELRRSFARTPRGAWWFIHLAEGTDAVAAAEYGHLRALGCAEARTVLIHGVGLTGADRAEAARTVRGLVVCPTTNRFLLGAEPDVRGWLNSGGRLAIGSDSRLTADGDLLDEIARAGEMLPDVRPAAWARRACDLLNLPGAGTLDPGAPGDLIAAPHFPRRRSEIALVMRSGVPLIGDPPLMAQFRGVETVPATLDGAPKAIHAALARQLTRCALREPGLEIG